ncbi:putative membrane-bound dehydrogenase-like protein [Dyadobacter sp. BE34]|uniref:Membrane-bound dehydrogenase-like protein n=1 Tax=Dyadobacter fermentans TaxID=94254 RepID=A0ABU1QRA2_9BACT|nr:MULTISPECIES: PVC-type heme-binding CxxCH protein [Dyadobacter]MDR6803671.1 putative membrane-bound dehydrogenase-like protein [Dyadobacter fermentans]MDR7041411.1 putative membrane-bound dehydrogenase-like protein [Dyadobacter sp. BE242]MDR7195815.1 putative membrane-bound dehydrogenase-like protein [Dyadobacter sp. BE34]MDR7213641.1 putative membrane-bound dehydrogenase-like protein [Dyadobacter sp. BE31]MDR7261221.1 putative membrane-bound dehydrogenase-like protein [Dyadobacter sp. BE32
MRNYIALLLVGLMALACAKSKIGGPASRASAAGTPDHKAGASKGRRAEVLFLGHNSKHHDSGKYAPWLSIKLFKSGINMSYTTNPNDINPENLAKYDGLIIYANHDSLSPLQESAMKAFVEGGKGLIPIHSASGCFRNSTWYIKTIGGQFASHKTGSFKNTILKPEHQVMKGITDFQTWDETYVHKNLNPDKTVLGERVEGRLEGDVHEPYTWVRNEGKGRVFYTAYGHEDSTWTNKGFLDLVRNGVLWAIGDQVQAQIAALNLPDVDIYNSDTISHYTKRHVVPKMQESLSPAESNKLTQIPPDFEIQLFASEPDITNPIAMSWDERGRLWVVESVDYPNTFKETDGASNDRIKICEDTNGDGKADKFTVFADKLNIPTSMVFSNGGVIVSMAPDFVFLKDTNGDDVADVREVIITGWGKNDTHAGPSNLQYGFDNKIWGVLGYSAFNGTINGKKMSFSQGLYNFKPDGKEFEYLGSSSNNTWGLGFTEDNNVFLSTANNTHSAFFSMPGRLMQRTLGEEQPSVQAIQKIDGHYDAHAVTPNLRQVDVVGGFTSAAGHHFYTARNYPKEYWNRVALVTEPTIRLIHKAILEPDGAGFKEKDGWNFMASSDEWFGPVQAEVGPDGAVWVADWYNFIIQHNVFVPAQSPSKFILPFEEQPHGPGNAFSSPMRDLNHGRIYRIVYKNGKKSPALKLSKDDLPGLVAALENDNMFWRMTAQRLLVESKKLSVLPDLYKIINNPKVDEIGLNSPAVHALWTLHGLGALDGSNAEALQVVSKALTYPAAGVRKAAASVLPKQAQSFEILEKGMKDANLNTRLGVFVAIAELPASEKAGRAIYQASLDEQNAKDPWLSRAILAAAIQHEKGFLAAAGKQSQPSALTSQVTEALSREVYPLGRRNTLQFPPDVSGKEITIRASITKARDRALQGFIAGQGGKDGGYALYIQDGKLIMAVKQHGMLSKASTKDPLPDKFDVVASLTEGGNIRIEIDGKEAATGKAHMLFNAPLSNSVRSGEDMEGEDKVGDYEGRFGFVGNFQKASLELNRPNEGGSNAASLAQSASKTAASNATVIELKVEKEIMQYDKKLITAKAGQKVVINLENPDGMQHNLLIIKPGTLQKVGKAADELLANPKAAEMQYVPKIPEVLFSTRLVNSGETVTLEITVPNEPGDYPYVCTFPGHWRGMNGILRVTK